MIMMKLSWLVLEGLLFWSFLYAGSGSALALAVLMILMPLCLLLVNLHLKKHLTVSIDAAVSLRKGDE